jgi:hypothetical protein
MHSPRAVGTWGENSWRSLLLGALLALPVGAPLVAQISAESAPQSSPQNRPERGASDLRRRLAARRARPSAGSAGQLLLQRHVCRDPNVGGNAAFSVLVPKGWRAQSRVIWDLRYHTLAQPWLRAVSPDGSVQVETLPVIPFAWSQQGAQFIPVGGNWLGAEMRPPILEPRAFVEQIVLPRQRRDVQGARVLSSQEMPEVAAAVHAQLMAESREQIQMGTRIQAQARAARVRVEFVHSGQRYQEDLYLSLFVVMVQAPMTPPIYMWAPTQVIAVRAAHGQLEGYESIAAVLRDSLRQEPLWHAQYQEVARMWRAGKQAQIRAAGRISEIISRNGDEMLRMHRDSWERRQRSEDRIADGWSRYMRGIDRYEDPFAGRSVSLPSGYDDAWVSSGGDYLLSNDAGFDPNVGSGSTSWRKMRASPLGH